MTRFEVRGATAGLATSLKHPDPLQLAYQLHEIFEERTYLRHGLEIREGDVVLDVGANVGVAAAFFALACGAGVVHSFEPVPQIFELLRENLRAFPACIAHGYGLSSAPGSSEITYYPKDLALSGLHADSERDRAQVRASLLNWGFSPEDADRELEGRFRGETMTCELRTVSSVLREYSLRQVHLLKIDVERAELDVLDGIEASDWARIGQVVAEVHDEGGRCERIDRMLSRRGLRVTVDQEEVMRGTPVRMLYARR